mgnify:CR=1 FL=1
MSDAPASVSPVPGQPGVYVNEATQEVFKLVEYRDDSKYDTEDLASGSISAGSSVDLFATQADKELLDTNLDTPRRLSRGETMVIRWIGVEVPLVVGNTIIAPIDIKRLCYSAVLEVKINKITIAEGPLVKFPSGYGLSGQTTENSAGIVAIGVPSTAARADLQKQHFITADHSISSKISFPDRAWDTDATTRPNLGSVMHVRVHLGGLISTAATK